MFWGSILLTSLLLNPMADSDRIGEARYQEALNRQCEEVLGFQPGSEQNMKCHLFYEKLFRRLYHMSGSVSKELADRIEQKIDKLNTTCENYFKDSAISKEALWTCIQEHAEMERDESTYQDSYRERQDYLRTIRHHHHHH